MDEDIPKLPYCSSTLAPKQRICCTKNAFNLYGVHVFKIHKNLAMVQMIDIRNDGVVIHTWKSTLQNPQNFLQHQILISPHRSQMRRRLQVDMEKNVFSMIQCALTGAILRIASKFWPPLFSFHLNPNPIVRKGWFHHYTLKKKNARGVWFLSI